MGSEAAHYFYSYRSQSLKAERDPLTGPTRSVRSDSFGFFRVHVSQKIRHRVYGVYLSPDGLARVRAGYRDLHNLIRYT